MGLDRQMFNVKYMYRGFGCGTGLCGTGIYILLYNVKYFVIKFINETDADILSKQINRFVSTLF